MNVRVLVDGSASGEALVLDEPLSLWGGLEPETGRIVEVNHPQRGATVTGRILVMPSGRGSSSSATILAEAIRPGTAPRAIVLAEPDGILAIGALTAAELYGEAIPIVVVSPDQYTGIADGETLSIGG
jgi:predicted aconitase with swiveling domain